MKRAADPIRSTNRQYTYGEYRTWPEDERWELIDGAAWDMSPAPARQHQDIVIAIAAAFYSALRRHRCRVYPAPFDVLLPDSDQTAEDDVTGCWSTGSSTPGTDMLRCTS